MIGKRIAVIGLLLACCSSFLHAKGDRQNFKIYDFSKGLDTYHNGSTLPDGFVQDSQNVLFDAQAPVQKRAGFTEVVLIAVGAPQQNIWSYTDSNNNPWIITRVQTTPFAETEAYSPVLPGVTISTVALSNITSEANAFGNAYFTDQGQGVYYWSGTAATNYVAGSPKGSIIATFHNRLWVAGLAVANGNQLYGSKYYDGTTWTTGPLATDPVQYPVGLQDNFDNITGLYVYLDTLYIFKHNSIYALYGFDQTNFQISQLTQECGCVDGNTIQTYNGGLKFLSLRGVENFDGYRCTRISDPVKNLVDPAIQVGSFSEQSWVQQAQTDWLAGTLSQVSTTVSPPALTIGTGTVTDNTAANFNAGTFNSTVVSGNSVVLSQNQTQLANNSFESGQSTNWTAGAGFSNASSLCSGSMTAQDGSLFENTLDGVTLSIKLTSNSSVIASQNATYSGGWTLNSISVPSQYTGYSVFLDFNNFNGDLTSDSFIANGNSIQYYVNECFQNPILLHALDNITNNPKSSISSGTFTSQIFDTGFSSSAIQINISSTSNTGFIGMVLRHSTAPAGPFSDLTSSLGTSATSNRYVQYIATFTTTSTDSVDSSLNSATLQWAASTGTFKSQIHNVGSMTNWGGFNVTDNLNDGNIVFSICESTNSNMSPPSSCVNQPINSQVNMATGTYVQWYATFTVTSATQTPSINNVTIQWFTGKNPVPLGSTVWDNRYWLTLTTSTVDSQNDSVLVLNSRGAWSNFSIHAGGFTQSQGSLYHTDSLSGNIYLDNQGFSDNGAPINAYVKTRDESLGDVAADDYLYVLYPSVSNTGSCTMTVKYDMDHSGHLMSLGSPLLSEFSARRSVRLPFPIDSTHQDFGQSISFTVGTNDSACDWQFFGLEGLYKTRPIQ